MRTYNYFKRRNAKWVSYVIGGTILQIFIVLVFLYIILRSRSIKLCVRSAKIEGLRTNNSSFSMLLHMQVTIKNSNFGHYKFDNSSVVLTYRGTPVGETGFGSGHAKARSTKKINVTVAVGSKPWTGYVSGDGGSGKIILTASAQVTGKVHMMKVIRRRKSAWMNCTMDVDTKTQAIDNLHCK